MKNTLIIILAILFILAGAWYVFKPVEPSDSESQLIHERDSLMIEFKKIQAGYDLKALQLSRLEASLIESKAVVKRSEEKLTQAKANEKVYLKRIKEQTLAMSEIQADSAIKEIFKDDPDSISQKVLFSLSKLERCDSVRMVQDSLIVSFRQHQFLSDSVHNSLESMLDYRDKQNSLLLLSSSKDRQLIDIKTKENKKLRRGNKFLKGGIVGTLAVIVALIVKR